MIPLISILIPTYERPDYLRRSLDQLALQRFTDFEVIITDDSASNAVEAFMGSHSYAFPIRYRRNHPALGTPRNWTSGMDLATGDWIKILHDDDWLSSPDSLAQYADAIRPELDLIFAGYQAVYEETDKKEVRVLRPDQFKRICSDPYRLFAGNLIGPPSVLMFRRTMDVSFDPALKWIVDWEGYIRMLQKHRAGYIGQPLICMSYNATQVTQSCFGNPAVEIPESLLFYQKHGDRTRCSWLTYDAWWRMIRNLSIRSVAELNQYAGEMSVPAFLKRIVRHQQLLPPACWKFGVLSKIGMFISYNFNR
ncbi:MAG: glycosyltransferase family 2 protein [Bacteroidota bacterium]